MKKKILKVGIFLTIIGFLALYYAYSNGYYERMQGEKIILTNQMIEEFERDVEAGKDISLDDYFEEVKDYSTKSTKMSLNLSSKASKVIDSIIKFIFQKLGSVVE